LNYEEEVCLVESAELWLKCFYKSNAPVYIKAGTVEIPDLIIVLYGILKVAIVLNAYLLVNALLN